MFSFINPGPSCIVPSSERIEEKEKASLLRTFEARESSQLPSSMSAAADELLMRLVVFFLWKEGEKERKDDQEQGRFKNSYKGAQIMKKSIILLACLFVCLGGAALAVAASASHPAQQAAEQKTFVGTVKSVTLADPVKGTKSEIVVLDEKNVSMTFLILSTTTINDAQEKPITLDKVTKGNKVSVEYTTTPAGVHEAKSIKIHK